MKREWIEKQPEEMPPSARRVIAISDNYVTHCAVAPKAKLESVIADYVRTYQFSGGNPDGNEWEWVATPWTFNGSAWIEGNCRPFDPTHYMSDRQYAALVAAWEKETAQ